MQLTRAWAGRVDAAAREEALLLLDDAALASGPKTILQTEMLDLVSLGL